MGRNKGKCLGVVDPHDVLHAKGTHGVHAILLGRDQVTPLQSIHKVIPRNLHR